MGSLTNSAGSKPDLLGVVRPMVRLVRDLPDYVGKTKTIGEAAQHVLRAMKDARQPDRMLFSDLPKACGFPAFEASGKIDAAQVEAYFTRLKSAFGELQRAYPDLLAEVKRLIVAAFGRELPLSQARRGIEHDARYVLNFAVDMKLKAFLLRAAGATTEDATWLESIATLLSGKPPTHWDDQDRARFEVQLAATARTFDHFRVLAYEMERTGFAILDGDPRMLRISISVPNCAELEKVVQVLSHLIAKGERVKANLRRILEKNHLLDNVDIGVAILAELARQLLSEREGKEIAP